MKKTGLVLLAATLLISWTVLAYSETVISLEQKPTKNPQHIQIDIKLSNGKGVAGYGGLVVFDKMRLKYISATQGDYLPNGGIFIRPIIREDDTYALSINVGDETQTGTTVTIVGQPLSVSEFFFQIPEVPPELALPDGEYWGISFLSSTPLGEDTLPIATDGDGTLVSFTFEVVNPEVPGTVVLAGLHLTDTNDELLPATITEMVITDLVPLVDESLATDINGDGEVNILDLVRVASYFGETVSDENAAADVNGDGEINILDLVRIAQDFGKSTTAPPPIDE